MAVYDLMYSSFHNNHFISGHIIVLYFENYALLKHYQINACDFYSSLNLSRINNIRTKLHLLLLFI